MNQHNRHRLALVELVLVTMIWGSGFIATQYAIESGLATEWIIALRFLIGAAAIGVIFRRKVAMSSKRAIQRGCVAGIILFSAFYFQTAGQAQTTVSNAAFITATNVMMIPILMWMLTRKRPPAKVFALCALTMLGVILLTVDLTAGVSFSKGDLLVLLCAVLFALHITYVGLCCSDEDAAQITFWQLLAAALAGVATVVFLRSEISVSQFQGGILPVAYLGLFSTCLCYLLQTHAQHYTTASQTGIVLSMEGVFGTLFSVLLGMELLRANMIVGGMLITISVILMETAQTGHAGQ